MQFKRTNWWKLWYVNEKKSLWLFDKLEKERIVYVKTRYSSKAYKAKIIPYEDNIKVIYDEPQKSITAGQSAVFYIDDIVIGGGKIIYSL